MENCYPDIKNPFDLGKRYVDVHAPYLDFHIKSNIDYESLGLNIQNCQNGVFTDEGYFFENEILANEKIELKTESENAK